MKFHHGLLIDITEKKNDKNHNIFIDSFCKSMKIDSHNGIGTLSTDDDEPRGRRQEVKFPLAALLRKLDSSSLCSSGRQNVRFAVQSEHEYVLIYLRSVSDRKFISNYWNESWLFINFVALYKLDSTASLVLKSLNNIILGLPICPLAGICLSRK